MSVHAAKPDLIWPSRPPAIAAVESGRFAKDGLEAKLELVHTVSPRTTLCDGLPDFVGCAAHDVPYAFNDGPGFR